MMESYEKKPYCRAHRPNATATATTVKGDFKINQSVTAPKAARRQPGADVTARQTFYVGGNQSLDQVGMKLHQDKTSINPHGYTPDKPAPPNRLRAQGVNKLEGTTFNETSMTNKASSAPVAEGDWSHNAPAAGGYDQGGYGEEEHHDQGGYDQGGYAQEEHHDQGGYDQGGYGQEEHHDQGGYDQGGYEQPAEETGYGQEGGYQEGGYQEGQEGGYQEGGYQEGGYQEGGGEYQEGGYQEGEYQEGEYQQGY